MYLIQFTKIFKKTTLLLAMLSISLFAYTQEICDNGIDDDGDGLIDCIDPQCAGQTNCLDSGVLPCLPSFYQVIDNELKILNPLNGAYIAIGGSGGNWNAAGYNIQDGFIYGMRAGSDGFQRLLKVDVFGNITDMGDIVREVTGQKLSGNWYAADINANNELIVFNNVSKNSVLVVNLNTREYSWQGLSGPNGIPAQTINDIAFRIVDNKYYGMDNGKKLWSIEPTTNTIAMVADLSFALPDIAGGNGACWTDGSGAVYVFNNSTGRIAKITLNSAGQVFDVEEIIYGEANNNNDGMSCPLASAPVETDCSDGIDNNNDGLIDCDDSDCIASQDCDDPMAEDCDNGIDDDGDGLIDSDDPDCNVSSGEENGLESNGRLASKINHRNFTNRKNNKHPGEDLPKYTRNNNRNGSSIDRFIPIDALYDTDTYISSPTDLLGITNATEVFSVDIFRNNARCAAILAMTTQSEVYEHTKFVCDRLDGSSITDISRIWVNGQDYIMAELVRENGSVEYAVSFSIYTDSNGNFVIENHWTLDQYPVIGDDYYNFQIWAKTTDDLRTLMTSVMTLVNDEATIGQINSSANPSVYVVNGTYTNNTITLNLRNLTQTQSLDAIGTKTLTETTTPITFNEVINTTGTEYQTVTMNIGSLFDAGFKLYHNDATTFDAVYLADGSWGLDYVAAGVSLADYTITPSNSPVLNNDYAVERNVSLSGEITEYISIYRSLRPRFGAKDLSDYDQLSCTIEASGLSSVQIVVVKESIENWQNQYKINVPLAAGLNEIIIPFSDLTSTASTLPFSAEDVQTILFNIEGNWVSPTAFDLNLSDVMFGAMEQTTAIDAPMYASIRSKISPNPTYQEATLNFISNHPGNYELHLTDQTGKRLWYTKGGYNTGDNNIIIHRKDVAAGLVFYHLILNNEKALSGKVMFID